MGEICFCKNLSYFQRLRVFYTSFGRHPANGLLLLYLPLLLTEKGRKSVVAVMAVAINLTNYSICPLFNATM
jgi:hypothetical protein